MCRGLNHVPGSSEMPDVSALWAPAPVPGQRPSAPAPFLLPSCVCGTTDSGSDRDAACPFHGSRALCPPQPDVRGRGLMNGDKEPASGAAWAQPEQEAEASPLPLRQTTTIIVSVALTTIY